MTWLKSRLPGAAFPVWFAGLIVVLLGAYVLVNDSGQRHPVHLVLPWTLLATGVVLLLIASWLGKRGRAKTAA